ncbi:ImmA/IrrE family metallo-endopeptidase [Pediococcus pentosaceus]|uniref:ImmA/IrrE family metallo-endopeptidase n=1 Tax=Pediococcus pentosaceus TaxID=1255 RepID=UPI001C92BA0B|nr:ImmA/IrrE family metallo-endopeptidase [Pediococcus pentosaceus]MBY4581300.1 ImmA/IrrE family metallo-endopeptidase [Pediococcus pentosaceus]
MKAKVRWNFARNAAIKVREAYGLNITRLPILELIEQIPDLRVITYSEMVEELNTRSPQLHADVNWVINNLADGSQDAAIIKMSNSTQKIILYHDKTASIIPERIRFTIAHELGHYFLKHTFSDSLGRNGISKENYDVMEREAEAFAQTLLIPPSALYIGENVNDIVRLHDVSRAAAKIAVEQTRYKYRFPTYKPDIDFSLREYTKLPSRFSLFNDDFFLSSYAIHCKNCNGISAFNYNESLMYCDYCGSNNIHVHDIININFNFYERVVPHTMIYPGIDVDSQGKALQCPICENEDITDGGYCQICGSFIINKCSGYNEGDFINMNEESNFTDGTRGCGTALSGKSRYCPICGCQSTFFFQELLINWENAKSEIESESFPF